MEVYLLKDLDNTKRSTYQTCPRKYYWSHVMGLVPIFGSTALRYGSAWHGILEGYYTHVMQNGWLHDGKALEAGIMLGKKVWDEESVTRTFSDDYRTFENLTKSFLTYLNHFSYEVGMLEVIATEQVFEIEMGPEGPEEATLFPWLEDGFLFTGRLDMQVMMNGAPWLVENKTTGQWLSTQTERLNRSAQLIGYNYAGAKTLNFKPEGSLINIHHLSARKNKAEQWGEPKIDFARVPQIFPAGDVFQWRRSLLHTANQIAFSFITGHWPMQFDSCYQYGRCAYTSLCEQNRPLEETQTEGMYTCQHWDVRNNRIGDVAEG
jgi:hypothetical protein